MTGHQPRDRHRPPPLAPAGAGATVRDTGHVLALERAALAAFTTPAPRTAASSASHPARPPGPPPQRCAPALRTDTATPDTATGTAAREVVVDLARYAAAAQGRNTLR